MPRIIYIYYRTSRESKYVSATYTEIYGFCWYNIVINGVTVSIGQSTMSGLEVLSGTGCYL
jgi:hypothetical protein